MFRSAITRTARLPGATTPLAARTFSSTARASIAKMSIIGRLAATPEEFTYNEAEGKTMVRYAVASSYGPRENQQTSWFNVASFATGGQKDFLLSLPQGTLVSVDADARMKTFDDKDGNKRSVLSLVQRQIDVLSRPKAKPLEETGDEGLVEEPSDYRQRV